mmetsp:Transcript_95435/g.274896  ORF Transcript_95435/g.274896 Transcript_95435/m.274896 type:complete len:260 (-) Transcript_95435:173-952(-)
MLRILPHPRISVHPLGLCNVEPRGRHGVRHDYHGPAALRASTFLMARAVLPLRGAHGDQNHQRLRWQRVGRNDDRGSSCEHTQRKAFGRDPVCRPHCHVRAEHLCSAGANTHEAVPRLQCVGLPFAVRGLGALPQARRPPGEKPFGRSSVAQKWLLGALAPGQRTLVDDNRVLLLFEFLPLQLLVQVVCAVSGWGADIHVFEGVPQHLTARDVHASFFRQDCVVRRLGRSPCALGRQEPRRFPDGGPSVCAGSRRSRQH